MHTSPSLITQQSSASNANTSPGKTNLTRGVAIEGKVVGGTAGKTSDLVLVGQGLNAGTENSGGHLALESQKVGGKTSNVGSSHGGTRDGVLR